MAGKCVGKWCFAAHDAAHFDYPLKGIIRKVSKIVKKPLLHAQ